MSTSRPSGNTGRTKTVSEVLPLKASVQVRFTDGTSIYLTQADYVSGKVYLYPGKELTASEIRSLSFEKKEISDYAYLVSLLSSGRAYSRQKLVDKLTRTKKETYPQANELIRKAEEEGYFDEKEYIRIYFSEKLAKGFRKKQIVSDLLVKERCSPELVERIGEEFEEQDGDETVGKAVESSGGRNLAAHIRNAVSKLVLKGYSPSSAQKAVKEYLRNHEETEEDFLEAGKNNCELEALQLYRTLGRNGEEKDGILSKIRKRLEGHGYDENDIVEAMEKLV